MLDKSPAGRRYGLIRDVPDPRDLGVARMLSRKSVVVPSTGDLEPWCGPKKDQGDLGACTGFAETGQVEFLFRKYTKSAPVLSPLFCYYMERMLDGTLDQGDCGSEGRTAVKVANQFGICLESEDIYNPKAFAVPPTPSQIMDAKFYKAGAYHKLANVQDMRECIASGYVFILGFAVYESFESSEVTDTGLMPIPKGDELFLGGHETLCIGYDDNKVCPNTHRPGALKVRNSYGDAWGDKGNFWMPYEVAANPKYFYDGWIQHFGKPW